MRQYSFVILFATSLLLATTEYQSLSGQTETTMEANAKENTGTAQENWYSRKSDWKGFEQFHFRVAGRNAYLVAPKAVAAGKPWVWRARFPGFHSEADLKLLEQGFHVVYVDVAGLYGSPKAIGIGDALYQFVVGQRGLSPRPALEGVSRGGLFVYNWALANPQCVSCIYCDTPVLDFKSWPAGQGMGRGHGDSWKECMLAYGLDNSTAATFQLNPVDRAEEIAAMKIPLLHIVSENDVIVPPKENTYVLKSRLKKFGQIMEVISVPQGTDQSGGHHFTHPAVDQVAEFMAKHASIDVSLRQRWLDKSGKILFLGDSITYAGDYVAFFETWLHYRRNKNSSPFPTVINVGLPSETVSGLSEEGHAGGRFPRPNLHDRLDRVLEQTKPELVFACYGINCGIYKPFDENRFEKFCQGIKQLKRKVHDSGAKLILITPPTYDAGHDLTAGQFNYDNVMKKYTKWLVHQNDEQTLVVDLHSAMNLQLSIRRMADKQFTFQADKVHPNSDGHWLIASQLADWFGDDTLRAHKSWESFVSGRKEPNASKATQMLIERRMRLLRDGYLSAIGHKRPGISKGLPLDEIKGKVQALNQSIKITGDY